MVLVRKIMLLVIVISGFSIHGFSQNQSDLLDLRGCGKSCSSSNYTIESVYLSDSGGTPITNSLLTCTPGTEQTTYISFTYTTSSTSNANNGRLFADLIVGDSTLFLNYYFGTINSAKTTADTLTLSQFPLTWTCGEVVTLRNPLLAWTTSASADLSLSYVCNDYPSAQCQTTVDIVVDAPLAVQFEYNAACLVGSSSEVTFTSTTNGGREAYQYAWAFTNASSSTSTLPNPVVQFNSSGTAELTVTDANGTQNTYSSAVDIPVTTNLTGTVTDHTDDENPDGAIVLDILSTGDYTFSWTGPDGFASSQQDISNLIAGDYSLIVTDAFGCTSTWDFEVLYFGALPITWGKVEALVHSDPSTITIKWSTVMERESSHFEIQRAIEGITDFQTLGRVASRGNSNQLTFYQFEDQLDASMSVQRAYYRICQFNIDGSFDYSQTVAAFFPQAPEGITDWVLYPNPTRGTQLYLNYRGPELLPKTPLRIDIIGPGSSIVVETTWLNAPIRLDHWVPHFPRGLIVVEVQYAGKIQRLKLIYE